MMATRGQASFTMQSLHGSSECAAAKGLGTARELGFVRQLRVRGGKGRESNTCCWQLM